MAYCDQAIVDAGLGIEAREYDQGTGVASMGCRGRGSRRGTRGLREANASTRVLPFENSVNLQSVRPSVQNEKSQAFH